MFKSFEFHKHISATMQTSLLIYHDLKRHTFGLVGKWTQVTLTDLGRNIVLPKDSIGFDDI